ncbi:MAG: RNA methyltransferase [Elusimicrobiota bacterium]
MKLFRAEGQQETGCPDLSDGKEGEGMKNTLITSLQNTSIKELVKIRQRRHRDRQKLYIIDGVRQLTFAIKNNFQIETLYFQEDLADKELIKLASAKSTALQPVTANVFKKTGYGDNPDGHLGLARQPEFKLKDMPCPSAPLYIIAENLEKPGNIGAILRSADASGVSGIIICDIHTDIFNPNVIRNSLGAFFTVPLAVADSAEAVRWLKERNVRIYAAVHDAHKSYTDIDLTGAAALAVGNEHSGLTEIWFEETGVRIPMVGQADSLNAAQTATILMFEAARQRNNGIPFNGR